MQRRSSMQPLKAVHHFQRRCAAGWSLGKRDKSSNKNKPAEQKLSPADGGTMVTKSIAFESMGLCARARGHLADEAMKQVPNSVAVPPIHTLCSEEVKAELEGYIASNDLSSSGGDPEEMLVRRLCNTASAKEVPSREFWVPIHYLKHKLEPIHLEVLGRRSIREVVMGLGERMAYSGEAIANSESVRLNRIWEMERYIEKRAWVYVVPTLTRSEAQMRAVMMFLVDLNAEEQFNGARKIAASGKPLSPLFQNMPANFSMRGVRLANTTIHEMSVHKGLSIRSQTVVDPRSFVDLAVDTLMERVDAPITHEAFAQQLRSLVGCAEYLCVADPEVKTKLFANRHQAVFLKTLRKKRTS